MPSDRPARVLVVGPLPPPYHGGSVATRYLLGSNVAREFEMVHVDTTDRRGLDNIGRLDAGNVFFALLHGARFVRLLVQHRPRLVYVPIAQNRLGFTRDCLFLLPALTLRKPVVVHLHGGGFAEFVDRTDRLTRALVRAVLRRVTRVIVLGESLGLAVGRYVNASRVAVVPNGVQDAVPEQATIATDPTPDDESDRPLTVLYLGSLMEAKGFLDLIEAVKRLVMQGHRLRLVLAGTFFRRSDREKAEAAVKGFESQVEFVGVVDGDLKVSLLRSADVFALPTRYENEAHPYVVLEAMAAGLPVVATSRGAIAETVVAGTTGLIIAEGDVDQLAHSILLIAHDHALRERLGAAGRRRFEELYTVDRWSERMSAVLREALEQGAGRQRNVQHRPQPHGAGCQTGS